MSALVTPGGLRSALAVTRSLGRRGVGVTVADEDGRSLAGVSRYCRASVRVPSAARSGEAFVSAIRQEVGRGKHSVVIPADDVTLSLHDALPISAFDRTSSSFAASAGSRVMMR